MRSSVLALSVSLLALSGTAHAHFTLLAPPPASNSTNGGKGNPPCGPTDTLSNVITPVMGGSKLMIKVNETVFHPGFYRIALSIKSRAELPLDNVVKDASGKVLPPTGPGTSATAVYQTTPVFPVLADNLFPHTTDMKMFTGEVTVPNVNCDKCTLQVIEFMAMHGPNGQAGYFYHHCADLKITADTSKPVFDPTAGTGAGGGSSGGAGNVAGASGAVGASGAPGASGGPAGAAGATPIGSGGTGGSSGGGTSTGISGGGSAGAGLGVAGALAAAGSPTSSAGASTAAGAMGTASTGDAADSGGCAVSNHAAGSKAWLSLLVGLFVLGRRRVRRR